MKEINAKMYTFRLVVFSIHIHYSFSYEARLCFAGIDRVHIALSCWVKVMRVIKSRRLQKQVSAVTLSKECLEKTANFTNNRLTSKGNCSLACAVRTLSMSTALIVSLNAMPIVNLKILALSRTCNILRTSCHSN